MRHLDIHQVEAGDRVIGSLPINIVAKLCEMGAEYWHLSIHVPESLRGEELDLQQLEALQPKLTKFLVQTCQTATTMY